MEKKALCLIDHSLESSYALRFACMLGKESQTTVHAMHVIHTIPFVLRWGMGYARKHWEQEQISNMEKEIKRMIASEPRCNSVSIKPIVKIGSVSGEITDQLKRESYDIVVTGVHYSQISQKPYLGRLHTHLIDRSPYPLAMVTSFKTPDKILLYLDGTISLEKIQEFTRKFFADKSITIVAETKDIINNASAIGQGEVIEKGKLLEELKRRVMNIDTFIVASGNVESLLVISREVMPYMLGALVLCR